MKAITIKQPWASLIALGEKKIETRSWNTKHRGPILIHAGKSIDKIAMKTLCIKEALEKHGINGPEDLPTGCIIAKANLDEVCRVEKANDTLRQAWSMDKEGNLILLAQGNEYLFGGYIREPGKHRYGWKLSDVETIEPIPCKGQLSIWNYEGDRMTPLEKALKASKSICCSNCKNRTVVKGVNYCCVSGKLVIDSFLDSNRSNCCKDKFKHGGGMIYE